MRVRGACLIVLCTAMFAFFAVPASAHEDSKSSEQTKEEKAEEEAKAAEEERKAEEKEKKEAEKKAEEEKKAEAKEKEEAKKESESSKSSGHCRKYFFRYVDGVIDSGTFCDGNDVTRSEVPDLHAVMLHVSCSDQFPNGYPEKSDLGSHNRVANWSISDPETGETLCSDETSSSDDDKSSDDKKSSKSGDCRGYRFMYDDGHLDEGIFCGGNDVTRSEVPDLHAVTLHISCSDQFPNGIPEKSDIGDHERVTDWMIYDSATGEILCPDDAVLAQTTQREEPCDDDATMPGTQPCLEAAPCDADATMPGTQPCLTDEGPCDMDATMPGTQPCLTDEGPCDMDATMPGTQPCEDEGDDVLGERINNGPDRPAAAPQDDVAAAGQTAGAELPFTGAPLSTFFVTSLVLMSGGIAALRARRKRQTT